MREKSKPENEFTRSRGASARRDAVLFTWVDVELQRRHKTCLVQIPTHARGRGIYRARSIVDLQMLFIFFLGKNRRSSLEIQNEIKFTEALTKIQNYCRVWA